GDERAPRTHQGNSRYAVRPPARRRDDACRSALCRIAQPHLAPAPYGAAERSAGRMSDAVQTTSAALLDEVEEQANTRRAALQRKRRRQLQMLGIRILSLAIVLAIWQVAGSHADPVLFTTPYAIANAAVTMIGNGELWTYLWPSLVV